VAERIIARDNKESILSISIKAYGMPEYGGTIKAGSFYPKPKVDSAIIAIRNISKKRFKEIPLLTSSETKDEKQIEEKFFKILKAGFAHKRKLLIKNLGVKKEIFEKCGISEKARAENLKVKDWICLAKKLT
jgi:16S rRNA A1518/A1519 N6-dimethyltransferase RsmA/KsgA/DIM1 with predicted DNA glycosylase/AP lyase activity